MELSTTPSTRARSRLIDYPVTAIQLGRLALGYEDPINLTSDQLEP